MTTLPCQTLIASAAFDVAEPTPARIVELCRGAQLAPRDMAAILNAPARLRLYRKLLRGNVEGVCSAVVPRGIAMCELAAAGSWRAVLDEFLERRGPRTPHLRDVPREVYEHARAGRLDAPCFEQAREMFRYELSLFEVGCADDLLAPDVSEIDVSKPVVFREPCRVESYAWNVHLYDAALPPKVAPTTLLHYRDASTLDDATLVLTPFAAEILTRIRAGETLGVSIAAAAAAVGAPLSEPVLADVARLLESLAERKIVLGAPA